jgi:hypothetical protein
MVARGEHGVRPAGQPMAGACMRLT